MRLAVALIASLCLARVADAAAVADSAEMTPAAEASMKRGLANLAGNQREDGSFTSDYGTSTGVVAAGCLAFMGSGQTPDSGEYGQNVARCLRYLQKSAQPNGLIFKAGMAGAPMYNHGLATLAMAEAWGMSQDKAVRDVIKRAADLIVSTQNPKGGWRYHPDASDADISSTVMQLMALRACKDAGIYVPKEVIDAGIAYVKACHNSKEKGKDGGFAYTPNEASGFARTGAGVLSLQVAGNYRAGEVREGVAYILNFPPLGNGPVERPDFYYYGQYYAAMAIYQSQSIGDWGRKAWGAWYPAITKSLIETQQPQGHWWDGYFGLYPTAMALLVLEIPCRYLPIYQR
jgi:hypothetical protein